MICVSMNETHRGIIQFSSFHLRQIYLPSYRHLDVSSTIRLCPIAEAAQLASTYHRCDLQRRLVRAVSLSNMLSGFRRASVIKCILLLCQSTTYCASLYFVSALWPICLWTASIAPAATVCSANCKLFLLLLDSFLCSSLWPLALLLLLLLRILSRAPFKLVSMLFLVYPSCCTISDCSAAV